MSLSFRVLLDRVLADYLKRHDLGKLIGADGMMRLFPGLVRIPDVAFISWKRYPEEDAEARRDPHGDTRPCRGSPQQGKHPGEMARKLDEYFRAGVRQVWYVDPKRRTVRVFTDRDRSVVLGRINISTAATSFPASPFPSATGSARPNEPPRDDSPEPPRNCPASPPLLSLPGSRTPTSLLALLLRNLALCRTADLDLPGLCGLRLGQGQRENAVLEIGLGLV